MYFSSFCLRSLEPPFLLFFLKFRILKNSCFISKFVFFFFSFFFLFFFVFSFFHFVKWKFSGLINKSLPSPPSFVSKVLPLSLSLSHVPPPLSIDQKYKKNMNPTTRDEHIISSSCRQESCPGYTPCVSCASPYGLVRDPQQSQMINNTLDCRGVKKNSCSNTHQCQLHKQEHPPPSPLPKCLEATAPLDNVVAAACIPTAANCCQDFTTSSTPLYFPSAPSCVWRQ